MDDKSLQPTPPPPTTQPRKMTAYGLPERSDPSSQGYVLVSHQGPTRRKAGEVFRDPTNGKTYTVDEAGSLRRVEISTDAEGRRIATAHRRHPRRRRR